MIKRKYFSDMLKNVMMNNSENDYMELIIPCHLGTNL